MTNEVIISNHNYYCKKIDVQTARDIVKRYHYSGKVFPNSTVHLGIFDINTNEICGALSYGFTMNPDSTPKKLVKDGNKNSMLELNRMAMFDSAPKLSESQALSLSIKWIKQNMPEIKWLLSFSDGKEGNVGIIYQATNWTYYGYKISSSFYDLDGTITHSIPIYHKHKVDKLSGETTLKYLFRSYNNVSKIEARQHIYIMPLVRKLEVLLDIMPYPKKESEPLITKKTIYKKDGKVLAKKEVIVY